MGSGTTTTLDFDRRPLARQKGPLLNCPRFRGAVRGADTSALEISPAIASLINGTVVTLGEYLLAPLPHVVLGDFNCVVDTVRDIREQVCGGSAYRAKELIKVLECLRLSDAWVRLRDDDFGPTRVSRVTASRLDRAYLPKLLLPSLTACEVVPLPPRQTTLSDHAPLLTTLRAKPGPKPADASWRLDSALLKDPVSAPQIETLIEASIRASPNVTSTTWDDLKEAWKVLL
ncbi:hypothetical protein HPB51_000516 [Rhipicephalus microplus]|uniref:Endonuclease/exonuclease/phosphatase domain-containing protein n=1 Tax=Rhipicephalus microplus TaxID=6941 RepID=A0A9J6DR06_RHIMP|nr:hypothetical protein HPB51_000516 [Rhipicephalus microplus]